MCFCACTTTGHSAGKLCKVTPLRGREVKKCTRLFDVLQAQRFRDVDNAYGTLCINISKIYSR